jgi:predicted alpha-1,2-mannosidase
MKFSRAFKRCDVFVDDKAGGEGMTTAAGKNLKCVVHLPTHEGEQVLVKVALSAVSTEGALRNLEAEVPGWDFDGVRAAAKHEWQSELGRMQITSMDTRHQRMFYSALYHSLLAPTLFNDVDGQYRGADLQVRKLPAGTNTYTEYSLWDTYRALHPLFTLVQPERVPDLINGMILIAEQSPDGVPVWPLQARETGTMPGYHSASVLAEAQAKGFKGIDYAHAYPLWRKRAMDDNYRGLPLYRAKGFIPADKESESVSKTLEYSYDDWAMASLATAVGQHADAALLKKRSQNYQHVFDAKLQFVRPKLDDGSWTEPFDPRDMGHSSRWRDFTESNAWQATFLNQHDIHTYIGMFGGDKGFVSKLDALFTTDGTLPANAPPDIAGMVGQYAHGNEPSHHVAYMYAYAGQPWKTQSRVRNLLETMYDDKPDGEAGNDDCGQISAWLILSSLGLYPVDPVSGHYVFGSPAVVHAELALAEGRRLVIDAVNNSPANVYVQSVKFNGRAYDRNWITHADIARGGHLEFTMGATPNTGFGAAASARPPSFGKAAS